MPRQSKTPLARAADVEAATNALPALVRTAQSTSAALGTDHPDTLAAWEAVEQA